MPNYNFRLATEEDNPIDLVKDHCNTLGIPYNETILRESVYQFTKDDKSLSKGMILALEDDTPIGYLAFMVSTNFITGKKVATEIGFYCLKGQGRELMKLFELLGRELNCDACVMSQHGTEKNLDNYYKRAGYTLQEKSFIKELN